MCNKAVDSYLSAIKFVFEWLKTQEICDKTIDACPFLFHFIHD